MKLWLNSAGQVICEDQTTTPILCDTCPCEITCDDLRDAIRERQLACGITNPWSQEGMLTGKETNRQIGTCVQIEYTLTELKAYVNYLAPSYINTSTSWPGTGSTTLPVAYSSTYANTATDEDELYDLVCAILVRFQTAGQSNIDLVQWTGNGSEHTENPGLTADWEAAIAEAEAGYVYGRTIGSSFGDSVNHVYFFTAGWYDDLGLYDGIYYAQIRTSWMLLEGYGSSLYADLAKTVKLVGLGHPSAVGESNWTGDGQDVVDGGTVGTYYSLGSISIPASSTVDWDVIPDGIDEGVPPRWVDEPTTGTEKRRGFNFRPSDMKQMVMYAFVHQ